MNTVMQNENLDGNTFSLSGSKDVCVILIHGFTATTVEVKPLANELGKAGYSVICPLLPGHNTSPEDLNTKTWEDWTSSVNMILETALEDFNNVFIGGESMGGLIACILASRHNKIKGLLLFSPALFIPNLNWSKWIKYFRPIMPKPGRNRLEENTEIFPWKGYTVNPTKAANQLFKLQKIVKSNLSKIVSPIIIFQGKKDRTINPESSVYIFNHISSNEKKLVSMENSGHCVLIDQEFKEVLINVNTFIAGLI